MFFDLTEQAIDAAALRRRMLDNEQCGAFTCFEGWVRRQTTAAGWIIWYTALTKHWHANKEKLY